MDSEKNTNIDEAAKDYDPASEAYLVIRDTLLCDEQDLQTLQAAMEEALGYLGEILE